MSAPPELEASPSPLHDGDYSSIKINVAAAEAALQAVESCKARLVDLTDRACASFSAVIAKLLSSFSTTVSSARTTARRVCQRRAEWLGKHVEELDAVQEALLAAARLCGYHLTNTHLSGDASTLLLDLEPVMGLLRSGDALVRQSCALYAPDPVHFTDVIEVLLKMSRVQSGELSASSSTLTGPAIDFLTPGGPCDQNTLSITCLDDEGDPIRGLDASDVQLTLESATTGDGSSIGSVVSVSIDAEVGVVTIAFVVQDSTETDVRICVRVGSLTFPEAVSRVRGSIILCNTRTRTSFLLSFRLCLSLTHT